MPPLLAHPSFPPHLESCPRLCPCCRHRQVHGTEGQAAAARGEEEAMGVNRQALQIRTLGGLERERESSEAG